MIRLVRFGLVLSTLFAPFAACTSSSDQTTVTLSASTLTALGSGYVYEGWFITPAGPQSTGRFTVDAAGMPTPATSMIARSIVDQATAAVITIEPAVDDDPAPSSVHVLGG